MSTSDPNPASSTQPPSPGQLPSAPPSSGPLPPPAADTGRPSAGALVLGIILVVGGGGVLAARLLDVTLGPQAWPLWILVPGLALLAGSFAIPSRGGLGMAIPGAIVAVVGIVLLVQQTYGLYATWAYAWALVVPTGPGLGMLLYGLVRRDRPLAADGFRTTLVGLALFVGFGLLFEGVVGVSGHRIEHLDEVLPYAAIGLGLLLVVLSMLGGGRRRPA